MYLCDPARGTAVTDGGPICNIASVWDAEILGNFLERQVLRPFMERTLEYYSAWLVARDGYLIFDPKRLGNRRASPCGYRQSNARFPRSCLYRL